MKLRIPLAQIDIDDQIKSVVLNTLSSGKYILNEQTEKFEEEFARFCKVKYAACVSSGTAALFLTLQSLGIKKGDEIIVPSLSFFATASTVLMVGAKPKFVDSDEKNYTIDVSEIEKKITKKTRAIIPVHIYGHPVNMDKIIDVAKENSIFVIEDSAQAHGAKYKNRIVGSIGDTACFSFYPSKNLTVCGDGGIITTNNKELIEKIKILRNHGRTTKYLHHKLGYNLRFNEIQAAIGRIMLSRLEKNNEKRRKLARNYSEELTDTITKPIEESWATHVYHMYTIRSKFRDKLQRFLAKKQIETGIHYPIPLHKQPVFKRFKNHRLPKTEEVCSTTLSIPMFPSLTENQQKSVITTINKFISTQI